jgi:hypothetical protein
MFQGHVTYNKLYNKTCGFRGLICRPASSDYEELSIVGCEAVFTLIAFSRTALMLLTLHTIFTRIIIMRNN